MSQIPADLKYTEEHEWVKIEDNIATIGITDFAQGELGDIVFVEVESLDESLDKGEIFGSVEAVKTVSDLFLPLSGTVVEFNEDLESEPELINSSPYEKGWIIKLEIADKSELEELMEADQYSTLLGE